MIIYNTVLSNEDRNAVEQYLSDRYVITSGALPVELTSFTAASTSSATAVVLNWTTATEVNNYGFEIERQTVAQISNLSSKWETIGFVEGHGNSNSQKDYLFIDESAPSGTIQYRLKLIDTERKFEYSEIVEVEIENLPTEFELFQNYPNPFNPKTVIGYTIGTSHSPAKGFVILKIFDVLGNEVATLVNEEKKPGVYEVEFNASQLPSGVYFYRLRAGGYDITKKLILMK